MENHRRFLQRGFIGLQVCAGDVAGQGFLAASPGWQIAAPVGGEAAPRLPKSPRTPADLCLLQLPFLPPGRLSPVPCCHQLPWCKSPGWACPHCSAVRFWEQRDFGVEGRIWPWVGIPGAQEFFLIPWLGMKALHGEGSFSWRGGSRPAPCLSVRRKLIIEVTLLKKNSTLACLVVISGEITGTRGLANKRFNPQSYFRTRGRSPPPWGWGLRGPLAGSELGIEGAGGPVAMPEVWDFL